MTTRLPRPLKTGGRTTSGGRASVTTSTARGGAHSSHPRVPDQQSGSQRKLGQRTPCGEIDPL
eukprot:scaffold92595_cov62-Phaeocystis_antarctica.AAC.2